MAEAIELKRPGIEVLQVFEANSPTIVTPTLMPVIHGVCKQIVEVLETSSTGGSQLNSDARCVTPAWFEVTAASYATLNALNLGLSINNSPVISVLFAGSSLSNKAVVDTVNQALQDNNLYDAAYAEVLYTGTTQVGWRLRTQAGGDNQTIKVSAPATTDRPVLAAFSLAEDHVFSGSDTYQGSKLVAPFFGYPDPRSNIDELALDVTTPRFFLYMGNSTNLQEAKSDESMLVYGVVGGAGDITIIAPLDDGDGDATTPILRFTGEDFTVAGTAINLDGSINVTEKAHLVGSVDLSTISYAATGGTLNGLTLIITTDVGGPTTVTFPADPGGMTAYTDVVTEINTQFGAVVAELDAGKKLVLFSNGVAPATTLDIGAGTSNVALGFAADPALVNGKNFNITSLEGTTIELDYGTGPQLYTFRSILKWQTPSNILTQLEAAFGSAVGGKLSFSIASDVLRISTDEKGCDAFLNVVAGGTALAILGLTAATHSGDASARAGTPVVNPYAPLPGDDVYVDGVYKGRILQVAPGGVVTDLKLDTEHLVATPSPVWGSYYIVARNLPNTTGAVRPSPDLQISAAGALTVKHRLVRNTTGASTTTSSQMYVYYEALRLDVSTAASNPALLRLDDSTDITDLIEPVSADNPLALGLYFALLNSSNAQVSGIGVDEISDDQPYGTTDAYERVLEFLESKTVYTLVPLTHDMTVAALELTHVTTMSEPEYKGERICLFAAEFPTRAPDSSIASGTNGNAAGTPSALFSTGISNLAQLVLAAGVTPTGTIAVDEGLYLDLAADDEHYSIKSISGDTVTLRYAAIDFAAGENDDDFYAEAYPPLTVSGTFAVRLRGALLVDTNGNPDKDAIADAYQDIAVGFDSRRFWHHAVNNVKATLDGIEQVLPGFYWCAAKAGAIAGQPPQQSFTNFPITGFSAVTGTNDYFSDRQMNRMAAGGNCIPIQDVANGPIFERMSLSTDMTSIETRTDSITKSLDFTSIFLRRMLRTYIGRFNINQNYLDTLSHVLSGARAFLIGTGVLMDLDVNEIVQDEDEPDSVDIDLTADPNYPCNYIRIRLTV
jgi:hypothetical protein